MGQLRSVLPSISSSHVNGVVPQQGRCAQIMQVRGKTVLLTGATGGIGHAIASRLRAEGAGLVLTGRRVDAARDPDKLRRIFARQPAAWQMLLSWKYAAKHDQQDGDTPKMPGEPKRVQPSRDTDLTRKDKPG